MHFSRQNAGAQLVGWLTMAEVEKLFAIGQVVADNVHHSLRDPNKWGPIPSLIGIELGIAQLKFDISFKLGAGHAVPVAAHIF